MAELEITNDSAHVIAQLADNKSLFWRSLQPDLNEWLSQPGNSWTKLRKLVGVTRTNMNRYMHGSIPNTVTGFNIVTVLFPSPAEREKWHQRLLKMQEIEDESTILKRLPEQLAAANRPKLQRACQIMSAEFKPALLKLSKILARRSVENPRKQ